MAKQKQKQKRVRFYVSAHHNNEDFRPYKVSFNDRGSKKENVKRALELAIKKEGEWQGWLNHPEDGGDLGNDRTSEIRDMIASAVDEAYAYKSKTIERNVYGYDWDGSDAGGPSIVMNIGLVVWACFKKGDENFGFGLATKTEHGSKKALCSEHTDKYDNKWVSPV